MCIQQDTADICFDKFACGILWRRSLFTPCGFVLICIVWHSYIIVAVTLHGGGPSISGSFVFFVIGLSVLDFIYCYRCPVVFLLACVIVAVSACRVVA